MLHVNSMIYAMAVYIYIHVLHAIFWSAIHLSMLRSFQCGLEPRQEDREDGLLQELCRSGLCIMTSAAVKCTRVI